LQVFVGGIPKAVTVTDEQLHEFASQGGEVSVRQFMLIKYQYILS
jgi:hypothetical protein